MLFSFSDAVA